MTPCNLPTWSAAPWHWSLASLAHLLGDKHQAQPGLRVQSSHEVECKKLQVVAVSCEYAVEKMVSRTNIVVV